MSVAVLTDTNSGIYDSEASKMGIYVVPMPILIDEETYYEGVDILEKQLYEALEAGKDVHTSQPNPADLMDMWDKLLKRYDEVLYIPMSSGLSGSCNTAKAFAQDYDGKVVVVDNHRISFTQWCSVRQAKKMADAGCKADEIRWHLESAAYDCTIYITVNTLKYLKKSGRVTPAAAAIGDLLKIKPILSIQGERLDACAKVRGHMDKCKKKMLSLVKADWEKRFPDKKADEIIVAIAGAGLSKAEQDDWYDEVSEAFPGSWVVRTSLSASIGSHTGPGATGVSICFRD